MSLRRASWLAALILMTVIAGYTVALVLVSRDADELPPPAVTIVKTITIPPGESAQP